MNYLVIVFLRSNKHEIETISYVRKILERRYSDRKFRKNVKRQKWQVKYFYYCYDYYEFLINFEYRSVTIDSSPPISAILPEEASNKKRLNSENLDLFR